jgi:cyanophycinase
MPHPNDGRTRGTLVLIGGGDYQESERVDRVLLDLAGGPEAPVVFLPTPHPSPRVGEKFTQYYRSLGARNVRVAPVYTADDAREEGNAALLREAQLIFIGWGSDIRLQEAVQDSPVHAAIEAAYEGGAVLAGTSAGARATGDLVLTPASGPPGLRGGLDEGPRREYPGVPLEERMELQIWPGFNWLPGFGVEAHLAEWNRYGHLFLMGAPRPDLTWMGLDERTAAIIDPGGAVRVVGSGNVLVARRAPSVNVRPPEPGRALEARGLRIDVLADGSRTTLDELRAPPAD